jgi:hypothetical protein
MIDCPNMILKNQNQSNTQSKQKTLDELIECISNAKYLHLQLFLSRDGDVSQGLGQQYLMVTPSSFSLIKLIDLDFSNNQIYLDLQDINSGILKRISIDIDDDSFHFLLILWSDIRKMVLAENKTIFNNDEILEFDF